LRSRLLQKPGAVKNIKLKMQEVLQMKDW